MVLDNSGIFGRVTGVGDAPNFQVSGFLGGVVDSGSFSLFMALRKSGIFGRVIVVRDVPNAEFSSWIIRDAPFMAPANCS